MVAAACGGGDDDGGESAAPGECTPDDTQVITFASYSTPREVYGKIISEFTSAWKEKPENEGKNLIFQESYQGSTTQAENVVNGFEADIVALSLAPDVDYIADAGLITSDWTDQPDNGMVSSSVAVLDVRPGNPEGYADWNDIAVPGVEVLTPGPGILRRRAVEHRRGLRSGGSRTRRRQGRRQGRGAEAARGHLLQRDRAGQDRPRLDQELRGRQR